MLQSYGHEVDIFVSEKFEGPQCENIFALIPDGELIDYGIDPKYPSSRDLTPEHNKLADRTAEVLRTELKDYDVCFTHDLVFTGWNVPFSEGIKRAAEHLPGLKWLHWIHSLPLVPGDHCTMGRYGMNHKLICPTQINRQLVASQFEGTLSDVRVIPHIKDPRTAFKFGSETVRFLNDHKQILRSDVVQVYPVGTDRLSAKGLRELILVFKTIKTMYRRVCLIVANSWATGRMSKQSLDTYKRIAKRNGLEPGRDLIFTSDWDPQYEIGIPHDMVMELFRISNLFIFPSQVESFGLVLVEALMTGGILTVANRNVDSLFDVACGVGLFADFPSFRTSDEFKYPSGEAHYFERLAGQIIGQMEQENGIMGKTRAFKRYNWDNLYHKYYEPILAESDFWD